MRRRIHITARRATVAVIALAGVAVAVLGTAVLLGSGETQGAESALPLHPVAGSFKPDSTTIDECSDQTCVEQAYGNIAYRSGPHKALALLDREIGSSTNSCHRIAHIIGAASLARFHGDVARTFAEGSSTCASGYYHGVLERSLVNVTSRTGEGYGAAVRDLCSGPGIRRNAELEYQCLHGLGHGLMIATGYDLPLSLQVCDRLRTRVSATSCNGGVFMENFSTSYGVRSRWLRDDDPLYPCDSVAREDKLTCYQLVVTRMIQLDGLDWEALAAGCAAAERGFVSSCFQSFGLEAAAQTQRDPEGIRELCATARPYAGESACIEFAAYDMVQNDWSGTHAAELCVGEHGAVRRECFRAIGALMSRSRTAARTAAACRSLATARSDSVACASGAGVRVLAPPTR